MLIVRFWYYCISEVYRFCCKVDTSLLQKMLWTVTNRKQLLFCFKSPCVAVLQWTSGGNCEHVTWPVGRLSRRQEREGTLFAAWVLVLLLTSALSLPVFLSFSSASRPSAGGIYLTDCKNKWQVCKYKVTFKIRTLTYVPRCPCGHFASCHGSFLHPEVKAAVLV